MERKKMGFSTPNGKNAGEGLAVGVGDNPDRRDAIRVASYIVAWFDAGCGAFLIAALDAGYFNTETGPGIPMSGAATAGSVAQGWGRCNIKENILSNAAVAAKDHDAVEWLYFLAAVLVHEYVHMVDIPPPNSPTTPPPAAPTGGIGGGPGDGPGPPPPPTTPRNAPVYPREPHIPAYTVQLKFIKKVLESITGGEPPLPPFPPLPGRKVNTGKGNQPPTEGQRKAICKKLTYMAQGANDQIKAEIAKTGHTIGPNDPWPYVSIPGSEKYGGDHYEIDPRGPTTPSAGDFRPTSGEMRPRPPDPPKGPTTPKDEAPTGGEIRRRRPDQQSDSSQLDDDNVQLQGTNRQLRYILRSDDYSPIDSPQPFDEDGPVVSGFSQWSEADQYPQLEAFTIWDRQTINIHARAAKGGNWRLGRIQLPFRPTAICGVAWNTLFVSGIDDKLRSVVVRMELDIEKELILTAYQELLVSKSIGFPIDMVPMKHTPVLALLTARPTTIWQAGQEREELSYITSELSIPALAGMNSMVVSDTVGEPLRYHLSNKFRYQSHISSFTNLLTLEDSNRDGVIDNVITMAGSIRARCFECGRTPEGQLETPIQIRV